MESPTLKQTVKNIWDARFAWIGGGFIGLIGAALFLWVSIPQYRGTMTIAPANSMNGAEMSSLMANDDLFALRYMMQRVGVSGSTDFTRFKTMMTGHAVADLLLQSDRIRQGLKSMHTYTFETDVIWNASSLSKYLQRHLNIDPIGATALHHVNFDHPDPQFAAYFLSVLHGITDGLIRRQIKDNAAERVNYLQSAIESTQNPDHRRILTTLLMEQERLKMLVSMDADYAATLVEPPSYTHKPVSPHRALILLVSLLAGVAIGYIMFTALRHDE